MTSRLAIVVAAALCASCGLLSPSAADLRNDPHGHLVWAARTGDVAAIEALAASGVDLDAASRTPLAFVFPDFDHAGWTALQHAVQKHQVEAVRVLLEWGADPDARAERSYTPLLIATGLDDPAIARLLLDAGADTTLSRTIARQEPPGGPLWHLFERTMADANGRQSPEEALDRLTAAPSSRH